MPHEKRPTPHRAFVPAGKQAPGAGGAGSHRGDVLATVQMRDFIKRVIAFETRGNGPSGATTPVAFAVCEKLRPQWANLMGAIGFRTLLSRALKMASAEIPWLNEVRVRADGSLEATEKMDAQMDPKTIEGSVALIIKLLGLLEGFIGETLAMRLMQDMWPKLPLNDSDSDKGK